MLLVRTIRIWLALWDRFVLIGTIYATPTPPGSDPSSSGLEEILARVF